MRKPIIPFATALILLLCAVNVSAQKFFSNSLPHTITDTGKTFLLDIDLCDTPIALQCPLTEDTGLNAYKKQITDLTVDRFQNLWYVTSQGNLYKKNINVPNSCSYVGNFEPGVFMNSLVADSGVTIYAAGFRQDTCVLYKYVDTGASKGFHYLGALPHGLVPAGDLFFYKHRLFLTALYPNVPGTFIEEVTLPDPQYSCYYMSLGKINAWGAFTVVSDPGTRVFVIGPNEQTATLKYTSSLVEIDIPNRKILDTICTYPYTMGSAGYFYGLTADSTTCITDTPTVVHHLTTNNGNFLKLLNPVSNTIRIQTNIPPSLIHTIVLYDQYGKKLKDFTTQDFPNNLNISGIQPGLYILHLTSRDGMQWVEKMIKTGD